MQCNIRIFAPKQEMSDKMSKRISGTNKCKQQTIVKKVFIQTVVQNLDFKKTGTHYTGL